MQKKNNHKEYFIAISLLVVLTGIIFYQFFFKGLYPFPGNYLIAWFEPWKTDHFINNVISIPHKAIAEDVFRQTYPFRTLAIDIVKNLQLPLWNPYNGAGMPLLATMNIGFLDPFNIIFFFIPYYLAWSIYIVLQPLLIGISTYIFCRKISLGNKSSVFSAISFMLSGVVITRLIYGMFGLAFALLPFLLFLLESYSQNRKTKLILLLPICIFSLIVSTIPQISSYILFFALLYFIYRITAGNQKVKGKEMLFIMLLLLIGIGLSSIQLFPTFELFQNANINKEASQFIFQHYLLPIQHLITILIPNYYGNPSTYNYWGYADYIETAAYVGLIPCFFAFLGIFKKMSHDKFRIRFFLLLTLVTSLLLSISWFPTRWLYSYSIPIVSTGVPSRIFLITTFSIAILSGFGFEFLIRKEIPLKKFLVNTLIFFFPVSIIAFLTIFAYISKSPCPPGPILNCRIISVRNMGIEITGVSIAVILSYLSLITVSKKRLILPLVIILLICGIGIYNSYKFLPFSDKETFLAKNSLIKIIQERTRDGRVFGLGEANIKTDFATYFRFYDPQYYHPLYIKRYGELVSYANSGKFENILPRSDIEIANSLQSRNNDLEQKRDRLFNLLSIKYLIFKKNEIKNSSNNIFWQDKNWIILKNNNSLSHAYFVGNFEVIKNRQQILERMFDPSFNPINSVILEEKPNLDEGKLNGSADKIEQINYTPNSILLKTNANENKLLVLTDNYYPGWKAYVDNKETKIYRANYTLRTIVIPKGKHDTRFEYKPDSLKTGIIISLSSLIILIITYLIRRKLNLKSE